MEILNAYGNDRIRTEWLTPLLNGEIRSAFAMTEPAVGSSDATNISLRIEKDGDEYVLNGRKWFTSGILADRAKVMIVMGKTDPDAPRHQQQSMIVVPKATAGVTVERSLTVFGNEDRGGHGQVLFENVRVPADHLLGEEGGGFAISQARLGPGRIHHCMRTIGVAEKALEYMVKRSLARRTFGTLVAEKGLIQDWIAESRIEIDMAREYVLRCAHLMDTVGQQGRRDRDLRASRWPSPTWRSRSSTVRSRCTARWASRRTRRSPRCGCTRGRCASPTAPTRSTR